MSSGAAAHLLDEFWDDVADDSDDFWNIEEDGGSSEEEPDHSDTQALVPRKQRRLEELASPLLSTPLDVFYEICSYLHPKDLLALSRVSKPMRGVLMSRNSVSAWKSARQRISGFPECPSLTSEPEWAYLIFGTTCQSCWKYRVRKVEFALRRRVCEACVDQHLVNADEFAKRFPNADVLVTIMIPHVIVSSHKPSHSRNIGSRAYWDTDIENMMRRFEKFEVDIYEGRSDRVAFDKFKLEKVTQVAKYLQTSGHYWEWYSENVKLWYQEETESLMRRLLALGWRDDEVGREDLLYVAHDFHIKKDLTPQQVIRVIFASEPRLDNEKLCKDAMSHLPEMISQWKVKRESELLAQLPKGSLSSPSDLGLATSVFVCASKECLGSSPSLSRRLLISHFLPSNVKHLESHASPRWIMLSSDARDSLLSKEGMDPAWNSPHWVCAHCTNNPGVHVFKSSDRPTAIDHIRTRYLDLLSLPSPSDETHGVPSHNVDSPNEDIDFFWDPSAVKPDDRHAIHAPFEGQFDIAANTNETIMQYQCALCTNQKLRKFLLPGVREHLRMKHGIPSAVEGSDFLPI
ncbi:hypothetical protein JAAARDRAFT_194740 [Jaapia argillacea MUCL 33604]|uniref:F-box domain-containing protein n=1 Tax=Jaapia argillacea MUCL 33604 TaxID=933084 RepID=A0A067PSH2_9AGAM|nr:hypothetical protein JAAARDRAFT_194740 [Jaapia argillacea MUCL 33604]